MNMVASHEWIRQWADEAGHIEPSACWGGCQHAGGEEGEGRCFLQRVRERDKKLEWREVDGGAACSSCLWMPRGWFTWRSRELTWWVFSTARKPGCSVSQKQRIAYVFAGHLDRMASYTKILRYSWFVLVCVCVWPILVYINTVYACVCEVFYEACVVAELGNCILEQLERKCTWITLSVRQLSLKTFEVRCVTANCSVVNIGRFLFHTKMHAC